MGKVIVRFIHSIRGVLRPAFRMALEDDLIRRNSFEFELATVIVNDSVTREAITLPKIYPKGGKQAKRVEETRSRRLEISTQTAEISRKGRENAPRCPATLNVPPEMVFHSTETIKATIVYFRTGGHINTKKG